MPLYNTDAIVLKSIALGEADKIVTFFSRRYGKIQGVAKGSRRVKSRFGASLESLTYINLIYFGKENTNLYKVNSCDIVESFRKCRDDFDKLKRGLFICDLVNSTVRELDVNLKIFDLFLNTLRIIERTEDTEKLDMLIDIFGLRLLSDAGFAPKLNSCVYCNKSQHSPLNTQHFNKIGFHILKGGIVCKDCLDGSEDSVRINYGTVSFMQKAIDISLSNLNRLSMTRDMERELHKLIRDYIHAHINREIKSYGMLDL